MKVLIISHNPLMTQNNMGKTFLSLFSEFRQEELCQLYIYPTMPNVDRCAAYYRVTDKEVLSSLLTRKKIGGEIDRSRISEIHGDYEDEKDEALYRNRKNKSPLRRLLRDAIWSVSNWYDQELRQWLDREKPDCIFVAPGPAKFIHNIALKIAKQRSIPIITYVCDEYYFVRRPNSALDRLQLKLLKAKIDKLMAHSARLAVICDALNREYSRHFGVEAATLMTGTGYEIRDAVRADGEPSAISYFGNIRCNRYLSLVQVGRALDGLNRELGTDYKLKIYTPEKDPQILGAFDGIRCVELPGFVTGAAFDEAFHQAELLLHVEAFDANSIDVVKHSVSTKIADSLASGIPLVAYAPAEVASMQHLTDHGCAIAAQSPEALGQMLLTAFTDSKARITAARNALKTAREFHDSSKTSLRLHALIEQIT